MSRRANFTEAELKRALKATKAAGVSVARVEIDRDGTLVIVAGVPEANRATDREKSNEWDDAI